MVKTTTDPNANSAVVKKFTAFLESKQLRKTPERFAIVRCVLAFNRHFTIEDVRHMLEDEVYHVSRATLYNTIDLLLEAGILVKLTFDGLPPQYERVPAIPHIHLICTQCDKVKEVRDTDLAAFMNARKYTAFTTAHYTLTAYGLCSTCARKRKRAKSK